MPDKYFRRSDSAWIADQGLLADTLQSSQLSTITAPRQLTVWVALVVGITCILLVAGFDVGQVAENAREHADRITLADL